MYCTYCRTIKPNLYRSLPSIVIVPSFKPIQSNLVSPFATLTRSSANPTCTQSIRQVSSVSLQFSQNRRSLRSDGDKEDVFSDDPFCITRLEAWPEVVQRRCSSRISSSSAALTTVGRKGVGFFSGSRMMISVRVKCSKVARRRPWDETGIGRWSASFCPFSKQILFLRPTWLIPPMFVRHARCG